VSGRSGPDPLLVASSAHVFVAELADPVLDDDDRHHLERVLRLRDGEAVTASDGAGGWLPCRFATGGVLRPDGEIRTDAAPDYEISVAFAPPKGDRPELVVQKLTELGADRIVPLRCDRGVVHWDGARLDKQMVRLARIVREAAMQSRRTRLPVLEAPTAFAIVADRPGAVLAAPGGGRLRPGPGPFLVGPEGGWSEDELRRPLSRVGLGDTVLRAETAAIAVCALAVSARADLVGD